ncbi:MAG: ankyrin repeat domain-containing protein [Lentisphaeria bacterium]|nr:ankyrin repeat domain-containing protein [Lentisphaeria bacterium]
MFVKVLDCPECSHRFNFEHESAELPERITCPGCKCSYPADDYSALVLCRNCNSKLQVPLEIFNDDDLICPQCGSELDFSESLLTEDAEDLTTFTGSGDTGSKFKCMLKAGDVFDKYQIVRLLGKGGMAEVYLAEHLLLKQPCALKLMRSGMESDDPIYVKRFLREAKLSHQFNHPNIVKVFDVGSDFKTGYLFIAMEYVEGKTLLELAKEKSLSEDELKIVLVSMANALNCLAEARVVHRDIKPSNIMLDANGVYKLMDLGIAKSESNHQAGEMTLTMEQSTIGTPSYASPEQCKSSHNVDIRSDIYSLGATIYHAASGKLPFDGSTAVETILNVLQSEAIPLNTYRPDLSGKMLDLVERMMRKNPLDRPATPDEILAELYRADDGIAGDVKRHLRKASGSWLKWLLPSKDVPLRKYLMRCCRVVIAVVLLVIIGVNFRHIANYYKAAKAREKRPEVKPQQFADLLKNRQPLMKYPDAEGEFAGKPARSGMQFARIKIFRPDQKNKIFEYDFAKTKPKNSNFFSHEMIKNGMVSLLDKKYEYTDKNNVKRQRTRMATLDYRKSPGDFTLAINFQLNKDVDCTFFNMSSISMGVYKKRLCFLVDNQYFIHTDMAIPVGSWANVVVSCDSDKRKFSVYSGDRLIGSYLLNRKFMFLSSVNFSVRGYDQALDCNIDYIALYDTVLNTQLPSPQQAAYMPPKVSTGRLPEGLVDFVVFQAAVVPDKPVKPSGAQPPETAPPASPVPLARKPATFTRSAAAAADTSAKTANSWQSDWRNIARRIGNASSDLASGTAGSLLEDQLQTASSYCNQFDSFCKQTRNDQSKHTAHMTSEQKRLYNEILTRREQLLREWRDRLIYLEKRNAAVKFAAAKQYSESANAKVQQEFRDYTRRRTDWGYNSSDLQFSSEFIDMLKNPQVDPNLHLTDATYGEYSGPAIFAISSGRIQKADEIYSVLIQRGADPSGLQKSSRRVSGYPDILIEYGLPTSQIQHNLNNIYKIRGKLRPTAEKSTKALFFDGAKLNNDHLSRAVLDNNRTLVLLLLAAGIDPNGQNKDGETALFNTYRTGNSENIRQLLLAAGADENITNHDGKRARDYAHIARFTGYWQRNNIAMCRKMLQEGFDPNTILANDRTLLTEACYGKSFTKIRMLMEFKADVTLKDRQGDTPLRALYYNLRNYSYRHKNMSSQEHRNLINTVRDLLLAGADLRNNPTGYGGESLNIFWYTVEHMASTEEGRELILFMLPYTKNFSDGHWRSISYTLANSQRLTQTLKAAIFQAMPEEVLGKHLHYALAAGCKFETNRLKKLLGRTQIRQAHYMTHNKSRTQITILHAAIYGKQSFETIRTILEAGADVNWRNNRGENALDITQNAALKNLLKKFQAAQSAQAPPEPQAQPAAKSYSGPEKSAAPGNAPVIQPLIAELSMPRTIERRLEWCEKRLTLLRSAKPDLPFRMEQIDFVSKQIAELKKQQSIAREVRQNMSRTQRLDFDTKSFISKAQKYLKSARYSSEARKLDDEIEEMVKFKPISANAVFRNPKNNQETTIGEFLVESDIIDKIEDRDQFLRRSFADVNKIKSVLNAQNGCKSDLIFFGKEDIDSDTPIFNWLKYNHNTFRDITIGAVYQTARVKDLLLLAPRINGITDNNGRTLMHYAAMADEPDFAAHLLYAGFTDINKADRDNLTPWQLALRSGSWQVVEFFKKHKLNTRDNPQDHKQYQMWAAVADGDVQTVEKLLEQGADCYAVNGKGLSLLRAACDADQIELIKLLLKRNVDIRRMDPSSYRGFYRANTALEIAIARYNPEAVRLLSQHYKKRVSPSMTSRKVLAFFLANALKTPQKAAEIETKTVEILDILSKDRSLLLHENLLVTTCGNLRVLARNKIDVGEKLLKFMLDATPPNQRHMASRYARRFPPGKLRDLFEQYMANENSARPGRRY